MEEKIRVLYVDDESTPLELCKVFLEKSGDFTVTTAESALDAIQLLEKERFDVVVSDYQMPEMNGIEFLVLVRTKFGQIPVILFTGKGREDVVIQAINSGADFYIQKGGDLSAQFAELSHKIKTAASRKGADDAVKRSEEKYRHLIEHSNEAIIVVQDGMPKLVNHQTVEFTGYSEQELLSMSISAFIHPDDRAMVVERYQKRMKDEDVPSRYTLRLGSKDGSTRWVEISVAAIDWEGRPATLNFLTDITARKKAEESLNESERRFRELSDLLPQTVYEADANGILTYANRIAFEWFGYTEDEFRQGLNVLQMLAPEDRELAGAAFRAILEGKVKLGLPGEYRAQKKDGSTFPITIYYSPVIVQGRITGLRGIIIDITERKRVEKELRTISAYNRSLLEASLDLFVTINSEGKVADVNTSTELATGYSREELIGTDFSDYFTEPEQAKAGYQRVFTQGTVRDYPLSIRNSDGHITPVLCNATVYRDETGNVSGVFAAVHDITERKRAEVALVENEERLRTILHSMQTGIIVIDAHTHTILDANQKSLDMIGGTKEAVLGSVCHSYICPAELGKCPITDLAQVIDSSERILISTKGKKIPIIKSVIPTILGGKKVLIESVIDITERKRAEDTIALTARKLTLMNDVTYQYIQNKITGLRGYADLSKDAKTEAERLSFIEKEEHVLADIHHLIRDTQEYQEIGSLLPRWIPVEQSIRIAVSRVSPKEDISIKSALSGLELYSDPLIEKIFANLIENAVLHGKTTRRITFSCEKTPGGLILICEDDGVGISSKDKVRLFDRSVGEKIHFGLFFVQECLLLSGMTIVETGKPGKGARFEITVPKGKWRMKDVNQ